MRRGLTEASAAERAQWLGELAQALEEAQKLVWQLSSTGLRGSELMALYGTIEATRVEVETLRLGRFRAPPAPNDPEWTNLPWRPADETDER